MTQHIYEIPTQKLQLFKQKIKKLNKRAERIGAKKILYNDLGTKFVNLGVNDKSPKIEVHQIALKGDVIKIQGYKFIGTLDHYSIPGKVIVKSVPGEQIPSEYYHSEPVCDHCGKKRYRKNTYVLTDEKGRTKQVGSNCIKDFVGIDPNKIANYFSSIYSVFDEIDNKERWFDISSNFWVFDQREILRVTCGLIELDGWVSRSQVMDEPATADMVLDLLVPAKSPSDANYQRKTFKMMGDLTRFDKEIDSAIEWLKNQDPRNEYIFNLQTLSTSEEIPAQMFGIWCSLIVAYRKVHNENQKYTNEFYGEVKQRLDLNVTVKNIKWISGLYGPVGIHTFMGDNGHKFIWFANTDPKMEVNEQYLIKGTIKKHEEYNKMKQTVLSRVKVIETK